MTYKIRTSCQKIVEIQFDLTTNQ